MPDYSKLPKGLISFLKGSQEVLPTAQRDANLAKFLDTSRIKDRLYHATPHEFTEFKPGGENPNMSGRAIWMSADPERQPASHNIHTKASNYKQGVRVMPVHVQAKNPMVLDDRGMIEWARDTFAGGSKEFPELMRPHWIDAVKREGYDSIQFADPYGHGDPHEVIMFEPNKIKSAIGNKGTYDTSKPDINEAKGGAIRMQVGGLTRLAMLAKGAKNVAPTTQHEAQLIKMLQEAPEMGDVSRGLFKAQAPQLSGLIDKLKTPERQSILPMPNRWFTKPNENPHVQPLVEKVLSANNMTRDQFHSGAFVDPRTGKILDTQIHQDVGVAIDPITNRPVMTSGGLSGRESLPADIGSMTNSNLLKQGKYFPSGGDPILDDIGFLATIEKSGMGHKYGLGTEYATPTMLRNTLGGDNPTLRPRSVGDVFGMGDVVGQIKTTAKGPTHDVYEKLFVAPKGSDVSGVKLNKAKGGGVHMQVGGLSALANVGKATKAGSKVNAAKNARAFSDNILQSTTNKMMEDLMSANPKLTPEVALDKAGKQAEKKLTWERETKPALVKQYGPLARASYEKSNPNKMQNTNEVVQKRIQKANDFLDQPTEPWTPPKPELQAFDRSTIKDALEGFPGMEQTAFPRDIPTRANTSHVEGLYTDPVNRELIKKQINRGLPLGGESFYASLYPIKQAVLEAGMPAEKFDKWVHALAPASARNSIINETAVGQFLRDMNARGIPLTEENVAVEMAKYKDKFGVGLPLMPLHRQGVANVLEGGQDLREMSKANIPTNYKIPTYGTQKTGDFGKSVVLDVHEAAGQTQGSKYHPYFKEQGGFGNTEYNAGEQGMMGIADELGIPGGMAQAGRWFGGGELTGLKSPRGDALDILERQVAYTLKQQGRQPNPANIREEVLNQIKTGEGQLLPWYKGEGIPDVRQTGLQRKDGGSIEAPPFHDFEKIINRKDGGTVNQSFEQRLKGALEQHMAMGGEVSDNTTPDMTDGGNINYGGQYARGGATRRYAEAGSVTAPTTQELESMADSQGAAFGFFPQMANKRFQQESPTMARASEMLKAQVTKEWEQAGRPGGAKELALRIGAVTAGQGGDLLNFAQTMIPGLYDEKPTSVLESGNKPPAPYRDTRELQRIPKLPMTGSPEIKQSMREKGMINEDEYPLFELAGAIGAPMALARAPKAIKGGLEATRSGLETAHATVRNPFQPATLTMEQVAPDLGQLGGDKFKDLLTRRLTTNEGAPVSMSTMGGRKTDKTSGQGLYENKAGAFETNPMTGVNIPRAGNLSTNKKLLADIGTAGQELGQEMVAAHKFTPLLFGNSKDATAMMVRGANGAPLNKKQIIELAGELPGMIATHSPKAGGMFVAPYGGDALDYARVQKAASKILGKDAQIKFGKADPDKDILYRGDYAAMGARPPSAESIAMRDRLKKAEARIVRGPSKSQPASNTQPPSLTSTLRSAP